MRLLFYLVISFSIIVKSRGAIFHYNAVVIGQFITLFANPQFSLEILDVVNGSVAYMNINNQIIKEQDLKFNAVAKSLDGTSLPIVMHPINLCEFLSSEASDNDNAMKQFHMSRVFNMEGERCPIPSGKRRLMPYMFPPSLSLRNDIGCAEFTFEMTIESCQGRRPGNCVPFIASSTNVLLTRTDFVSVVEQPDVNARARSCASWPPTTDTHCCQHLKTVCRITDDNYFPALSRATVIAAGESRALLLLPGSSQGSFSGCRSNGIPAVQAKESLDLPDVDNDDEAQCPLRIPLVGG
ncbi:hypothetical protein KM043_016727 [Ampulex compressa]|nr:hypothetical protein KM043_016727 [Ampulex compressa]